MKSFRGWCNGMSWLSGSKAEPPDGGSGGALSLAAASFRTGQGEIRLELRLLGRREGSEAFPLKTAQQKGPVDVVPLIGGVGAVERQAHVLALAVADEHDPLGQIAPGLNGTAHDLLKRLQRVLHGGGSGFLPRFHDQDVDFLVHADIPPFPVIL